MAKNFKDFLRELHDLADAALKGRLRSGDQHWTDAELEAMRRECRKRGVRIHQAA